MQINITSDIKAAEKALGALKKQIPFAASVGINNTLKDIRKVEQAAIARELDKPTRSTVRGIRYKGSTKRNLVGAVFIIPHIDKYLRYQIHGGKRKPRSRVEALPAQIKLNRYGNIPGRRQGKLRKLAARKNTFSATIGGVAGLWQRAGSKGRRLKLLVAYEQHTQYKPKFRFYHHAEKTVVRRWPRNFNRAISRALKTAR